jgi:hypothetical protein
LAGHVAQMGRRGIYEVICGEARKEKDHWGKKEVGEWMILRWISERWDGVVWTGSVWLRIETSEGLLWVR